MGAGLSWRNTDACQTFRSQGLPCLRLDCPLMPTHMGQRIYPVQEGPISPREGSTWGLAGHCSQCYINPHMDTDCPPIRAMLQTGAAQAEWAKHHLSQMGRQRDILCDFWHFTILDWGWPELKKERTFFSRSTRLEDRKKSDPAQLPDSHVTLGESCSSWEPQSDGEGEGGGQVILKPNSVPNANTIINANL